MGRYQFHRQRTARKKKIRSPIRVKERIASKGGRCAGCRARYEKGDEVTSVLIRRRVYHRKTCVPANVGVLPSSGVVGGPVMVTATQVAQAFSINWSLGEAKMVGLLGLENALAVAMKTGAIKYTEEIDNAFNKYNKIKGSAMRPGSDQEGKTAMMQAATRLIQLVFNS